MAHFPSDKVILLDGTIGSFSDLERTAAPATASDSRLRVFVSGDGASYPSAMGLDEDLRLLIQAFVQELHSGDRKKSAARPTSAAHGDIEIALHGLNLAPEDEGELHHLIRELVRKRTAGKESAK